MIKGVVYDLDGLMVDSEGLHREATEALLNVYGHSRKEISEEVKASFHGMRVIDVLKIIRKELKLQAGVGELFVKKEEIFLQLAKEKLQAMPGLLQSLELFRKNHYRMAVGSSGTRKWIDFALKKLLISKYFDAIVSGDDVMRGKPDPETYRLAAERLKLKPGECLVLEDAAKGVAAAKDAGCRCVGVLSGEYQNLSRADKIINSLGDLTIGMVKSLQF